MSGPPDLYQLLKVHKLSVVTNPPSPSIGGFVFVMDHFDSFEDFWFFSVNHQSCSDTGWQSERIYTREEAEFVASVLAEFLGAELIQEGGVH